MRCDAHKWTDLQHFAIPHNCLLLYWNYNLQQLHGTFRCLRKVWGGKTVRDAQYVYSTTKIIIMTKCVIYIFRHMWHRRVLAFGAIHHKWTSLPFMHHMSCVICWWHCVNANSVQSSFVQYVNCLRVFCAHPIDITKAMMRWPTTSRSVTDELKWFRAESFHQTQ